jgi:hypothetical protein
MAGKKDKAQAGDQGQAEVQARMDEAHAKGYEGYAPDPTPNSAYTVAGVTAGAPTPETDEKAAAKADEAAKEADQA